MCINFVLKLLSLLLLINIFYDIYIYISYFSTLCSFVYIWLLLIGFSSVRCLVIYNKIKYINKIKNITWGLPVVVDTPYSIIPPINSYSIVNSTESEYYIYVYIYINNIHFRYYWHIYISLWGVKFGNVWQENIKTRHIFRSKCTIFRNTFL